MLPLSLLVAAVTAVVLSFGAGSALASSTYHCANNAGSDAALQGVLDGNSTVTVYGTCVGNYFVNHSVTIQGGAPGATLNGNANGSVLTVNAVFVTLTVRNLRITNGFDSFGGGIQDGCWDATVNVVNSTVSGNTSDSDGGGIAVSCDEVVLTGSTVSGNAADAGGGIGVFDGGLLLATASTITGNTATDQGGGIAANHSFVTLTSTRVGGNTAQTYGGGIDYGDPFSCQVLGPFQGCASPHASGRHGADDVRRQQPVSVFEGLDLESSTVDHNTAWLGAGGGIDNYACGSDSPVLINKSSVTANRATGNDLDTDSGGGGIANYGNACGQDTTASVTITGSTFNGNLARSSVGGAIFNLNFGDGGAGIVSMSKTLGQPAMSLTTNQARWGGGVFNWGNSASVSLQGGAQIVHNTAFVTGGGLFNDCGATSLIGPGSLLMLNTPNNLVNNLGSCILSD